MKIAAIVQARMQSSRLPGKVMLELGGHPVLGLILQRLKRSRMIQEIIVASGDCPQNRPIFELAERYGVQGFLGPENDVLKRFVLAASQYKVDGIVRVTADCPLVDPNVIDEMVSTFLAGKYDYVTNVHPPTWPDGLDISVFTRKILEQADRQAAKFSERQHVVPWMWEAVFGSKNSGLRGMNLAAPEDLSHHRWVLDEPRDYDFFSALVRHLKAENLITVGWQDIVRVLRDHPDLSSLNAGIVRDEGLSLDRQKDSLTAKMNGKREGG